MPIDLIPVGDPIPAPTVPDISEVPEIPPKKGRGRPPGAKNKVKIPVAPVVPAVIEPPVSPPEPPPTEPSEESETETESSESEESPPPPPKRKRRPPEVAVAKAKPKARPKKQATVREATPSPPETPRTVKRRLYDEYRERRIEAVNSRKERSAVLLNRFMR